VLRSATHDGENWIARFGYGSLRRLRQGDPHGTEAPRSILVIVIVVVIILVVIVGLTRRIVVRRMALVVP
jgi:purine-cytosine permease-like protein